MDPRDFPRRPLVVVTGLSPQVVTETLYALAVTGAPAYVPTEVHLLTTREGAERARLSLLDPRTGWFHRLRRDYRLPEIAFGGDQIHVLHGRGGEALEDIRSPADNVDAADAIADRVRELTRDPDAAVHASIAGGRKTLGFYLGYALSLYGRPQDRLSHVLVSAPFESHPQFFYPTPEGEVIYTPPPDSRPHDTRDAEVTLAEIPFVRLRDGLHEDLLTGRAGFSDLVAEAQRALPPVALALDPATLTVTAAGESLTLRRAEFAFYWMLAARAREGRPGAHWSEDGLGEELLGYYGRLVNPASGDYERAEQAYRRGVAKENFEPVKSTLNKTLRRRLGQRRAAPYLIQPLDRIPGTRYHRFGLNLDPGAIGIAGDKRGGGVGATDSHDHPREVTP